MADPLKTQQQLNALQKKSLEYQKSVESSTSRSAGNIKEMSDSMSEADASGLSESLDGLSEMLESLPEHVEELQESFTDMTSDAAAGIISTISPMGKMVSSIKEAATSIKALGVAIGSYIADKAVAAFKFAVEGVKSFASFVASAAKGVFDIAKSLIAIPMRITDDLIDMAHSGPMMIEFAQAIERVRASMGSLAKTEGKAVMTAFRNIRGQVAETGLSSFRVFGNFAERLDFVREQAEGMGAAFSVFKNEMAGNIEAISAYQKGLGLTHEDMRTFGSIAISEGKSVTEVLHETANQAIQLGDTFNVSFKLIGKDVAKMAKDIGTFGDVGRKRLAEVATQARRMGIEIESTAGILDKFESFEGAAEAASGLARGFGAVVDPFKLMQAETPMDALMHVRDAMHEVGATSEKMGRRQLKFLSKQLGVSDLHMVKMALSAENAGKSLEDIQKESAKAEEKQLTQTEAMGKLADAIERMIKQGPQLKGGFFDMFMQGMTLGVKRSQEFMSVMWTLRRALRQTFRAGFQLGKKFMELMPGIKDMSDALKEYFSPKLFNKLTGSVNSAVTQLLTDIANPDVPPEEAVHKMLSKIRDAFLDFFSARGESQMKILAGVKKFVLAIGEMIAGAIPFLADSLDGVAEKIVDFFTDPKSLLPDMAMNAKKASKGFGAMFTRIFTNLKEALPRMFKALGRIFEAVWGWVSTDGWQMLKDAWKWLSNTAVDIWAEVKPKLIAAWESIKEWWDTTGSVYAEKAWAWLGEAMQGAWKKYIKPALGWAWDKVTGWFKSDGDKEGKKAGAWDWLGDALSDAWDDPIKPALINVFKFIGKWFLTDGIPLLATAFAALAVAVFTLPHMVIGSIAGNIVTGIAGTIKDMIPKSFSSIPEAISKPFQKAWDWIKDKFSGVANWFSTNVIDPIKDKFGPIGDIASKVMGFFGDDETEKMKKAVPKIDKPVITEKAVAATSAQLSALRDQFIGVSNDWNQIVEEPLNKSFKSIAKRMVKTFEVGWRIVKRISKPMPAWFDSRVTSPMEERFVTFSKSIVGVFRGMWKDIIGEFGENEKKLGKVMKALGQAISRPFIEMVKQFPDEMSDSMKRSATMMARAFDIRSPSRVTMDIGQKLVEGIRIGTKDMPDVMRERAKVSMSEASDMMVSTNNLKQRLDSNRAKVIDLKTKLHQLESGLGNNGTLTVKRPDHNIIINFKATMDAGTVERTLIDRPGTEIATVSRTFR